MTSRRLNQLHRNHFFQGKLLGKPKGCFLNQWMAPVDMELGKCSTTLTTTNWANPLDYNETIHINMAIRCKYDTHTKPNENTKPNELCIHHCHNYTTKQHPETPEWALSKITPKAINNVIIYIYSRVTIIEQNSSLGNS